MKWPWQRNHRVSEVTEYPKADPNAAEKAKHDAEAEREQVEKDNAYIEWLHDKLVNHAQENHFGALMRQAMEGRREHR